ncbi:MAG: 2-hydroxyacyl-CoA dehydratase family protein [Desulfobacterales bacterium]|jgi:benzoyl-CoA reductase/2-hydroxyglutaryl-CoA dehydratase subunit BcrC/BadD/HgdB|nr:2-hydroxyacyl-CoA dehydratase family protein [Desulfobacterales bacterium]
MRELLALCGYEKKEIENQLPRIQKAFHKLNITDRDIAGAKQRLTEYFEVNLSGFRKLLGVYMRELINFMLAVEEKGKRVYNTLPSLSSALGSAAALADDGIYAGFPSILLLMVYHGLFEKMAPVWEAAEKTVLTPAGAHCGCNRCKAGGHLLNLIPVPDLQLSWGICCDEAAKVDEYLSEVYDVPIVTVNRIMDENADEQFLFPDRSVGYLAEELRKAMDRISEVIGKKVTEEMLWQCLLEGRKYMQTIERIMRLVVEADPVPVSITTMWYVFMMYLCGPSRENVARLQDAVDTILRETKERVERGEGYYEKGAPRVTMFFPSFVDPAIARFIKEVGLAMPIVELDWFPGGALMPDLGETLQPDPYHIIAKGMFSVPLIGSLKQRAAHFTAAIRNYHIDGVLGLFPYACRPIAGDALALKDAIRKEMDIPVIVLEGDVYDDRRYPVEVIRTRIESFAEMCKIYRMSREENAA